MGVVWIASYPKSGNTWMRFLLANYLAGPIESSARVEELIPDLMKQRDLLALLNSRPTLYSKTHWSWSPAHPLANATEKAIVIVRHPKDVLLSNLNYRRLDRVMDKMFTDEQYATEFINQGGDPAYIVAGLGNLESNVASWLDASFTQPRLFVRYEDMKADVRKVLEEVVSFLGLPAEPEKLKMAATRSSFDQMRAIEVKEKVARKTTVFSGDAPRPGKPRYFMNKGEVRGSLAHISPEIDRAFDARFASLMQLLGYSKP